MTALILGGLVALVGLGLAASALSAGDPVVLAVGITLAVLGGVVAMLGGRR